uniref:Putative leucine-rich repeat lrr protein associated with apoptosis in muscle tissue n=1 Tax=Nyssomyia neivai TaxID=330878 RepID=A0A1L8DJM7_9DIPT
MRPPSQFGNDITNTTSNGNNDGDGFDPNGGGGAIPPSIAHLGGTLICARLAGNGVIRVVRRCDDAKENGTNLDLSECQLMQVPDAVYHLMRNTELKTCDLSCNVIKKIPPKFAVKFSLITDLNLSHNQMSKLPDELADLALERLDISFNNFTTLPQVVFKMPKLRHLAANNNSIIEVDSDEKAIKSESLEYVDLRSNPLTPQCYERLQGARLHFHLELSPRVQEDWEDLTI